MHKTEKVKDINPDSNQGLSSCEAKKRLVEFGKNLFVKEKTSFITLFFSQILNPISIILLIAAILSLITGEYIDGIVILVILTINTFLSLMQEYHSKKMVDNLCKVLGKESVVIRDGVKVSIDVSLLVPGDIVVLKSGDIVAADMKLINSYGLYVNEVGYTGETTVLPKHVSKSDEGNLYAGSIIESGHCQAIVTVTGENVRLGVLFKLTKKQKRLSSYEKSLKKFSLLLMKIVGASIVLMLAIKSFFIGDANEIFEVILFAIALAITVIPEALPMILTLTLSHGAALMFKKDMIVKKLSALETLGRINVLCSDKTGTLTEDNMTVEKIISYDKTNDFLLELFLCCKENYQDCLPTSPFDKAVEEYIKKENKIEVTHLKTVNFLPFEPQKRRRRVIVYDEKCNKHYLVLIGAYETLQHLCGEAFETDKEAVVNLRRLALAYKEIEFHNDFDIISNETNLKMAGYIEFFDPLRNFAKEFIEKSESLGVKVKILTGDGLSPAIDVGKKLGLLKEGEKVYTGDELDKLPQAEFVNIINKNNVFARVTPEQKHKIVESLKNNNIVGFIGDSLNDVPSMKSCDVAISVNNGSDVAKDNSDIVLIKDDLRLLTEGIKIGRQTLENTNKYLSHAMVGNLGNFFSLILYYLLFSKGLPMLGVQLLIGNLLQDIPMATISTDNVDEKETIYPKPLTQINDVVKSSLKLGAFTAVFYFLYLMIVGNVFPHVMQSMLFLFFNLTQLVIIFTVRSKNSMFFAKSKISKTLLLTIVICIALTFAIIYIPAISSLFSFQTLSFNEVLFVAAFSVLYFVLLDVFKVLMLKINKKIRSKK